MTCAMGFVAMLVMCLATSLSAFLRGQPRFGRAMSRSSQALFAEVPVPVAPASDSSDPYLVHVCVSCNYEYDEAKGFKKRVPAGSRMKDMKTFNCPGE